MRSLRTVEAPSFEALRSSMEAVAMKVSGSSVANVAPVNCKVEIRVRPSAIHNGVDYVARSMEKPRTLDDVTNKSKSCQLTEILDPVQFQMVNMLDSTDSGHKV